jgi:hypothetical protein
VKAGGARALARGLVFLAALPAVGAEPPRLRMVASGRTFAADGPVSWIDGGFGRLDDAGTGPGGTARRVRGRLHVGLDWEPSAAWRLHVHAVGQGEPSRYGGQQAGLTEAWVQYRPDLTPTLALRLRAGLAFPPTSLENVDPLWQSPYTVTLSAWNTWIGEELRPVGLDAAFVGRSAEGARWELAGSVFQAADTAGALLSWRGWGFGDRLSSAGEFLPVPPLSTLRPGRAFADQRDEGTRPVDELDGRPGFQVRGLVAPSPRLQVQGAWTDTRGDRGLHRGQYAWDTRFTQAGFEARAGDFTMVAEAAHGRTGMGPRPAPRVDIAFRAGYVLVSWARGRFRLSGRFDRFRNEDEDGLEEPDGEAGHAWTAAAFWQPKESVRVGLEYLDVRGRRPAAAFSGFPDDLAARRWLAEVRARF